MAKEILWPKKGIKVFASGKGMANFHLPSVLSCGPAHAFAFKEAADLIVDSCESNGDDPWNDVYLFPVSYLYRHGIELYLKSIIRSGVVKQWLTLMDVEKDMADHNLARLWTHAKRVLLTHWKKCNPETVLAVESVIHEIHQNDPNGQNFRYASDKAGRRHEYRNLPEYINIKNLKQTMDATFSFLEATSAALEELKSNRQLKG